MVTLQLPTTDTAGVALVWRLIQGLDNASHGMSPTSTGGEGFEFGLKALIILLALLVLAIFALCGIVLYIFATWRKDQATGIKALSANKDATKREVVAILEKQLSYADAATTSANSQLRGEIKKLNSVYNLIRLDLVVIAQKCKISLMSLPSHKPTNNQELNEDQENG